MRMDPRLKKYCKGSGLIFAGCAVAFLALLLKGCGDGPDLRTLDAAPAALVTGCAPPADAGAPDACYCPPGYICPLCGMGGFGE